MQGRGGGGVRGALGARGGTWGEGVAPECRVLGARSAGGSGGPRVRGSWGARGGAPGVRGGRGYGDTGCRALLASPSFPGVPGTCLLN